MEKAKKLIFISCVITLIISTINVLDTELLTSTIKQINLLKYNKLNKSICQIIKESCIIWIVAISFCIFAITMI